VKAGVLIGRTGGLAIALGVGMTLAVTASGIASAKDSGPGADASVGTHSPRHVSPAGRRSVQHPGPAAATAVRRLSNAPRTAAVLQPAGVAHEDRIGQLRADELRGYSRCRAKRSTG
jgi:hypothetical protein